MNATGALYTVSVRDAVNTELAEHTGRAYVSPPQAREQALALVALLVGGSAVAPTGDGRWTRAIAGGQRTITLASVETATDSQHDDEDARAAGNPAARRRRPAGGRHKPRLSTTMRKPMKITATDIRIQDGRASMRVTLEDGSKQDAIAWFPDELTFTPEDAIGRTVEELQALHFERDRAYLRS
jgi:hypothetical protein